MKYFIVRLIGFFLLLGLVAMAFKSVAPFYYGNHVLIPKFELLAEKKSEYNALAIGSSQIYRHLDPSTLEQKTEGRVRAFNMASGGMYGLEVFYVVDHMLENSFLEDFDFLFIEIQLPKMIAKENIHSVQGKYFMDRKRYKLGVEFVQENNPDNFKAQKRRYRTQYWERLFNIGMFRYQLYSCLPIAPSPSIVGKEGNGFVSLEFLVNSFGGHSFKKRREEFLSDLAIYRSNLDLIIRGENFDNIGPVSSSWLEEHKNIISRGAAKGVNVIFVLNSTSLNGDNKGEIEVYKALPENNRINLNDPLNYPELYDLDNYFDSGHFNLDGAVVFSEYFAAELISLLD